MMKNKRKEYSNIGNGDIAIALHYFDNKCCYCRTPLILESGCDNSLEMEHYISLSQQEYSGSVILDGTVTNRVPSCRSCNRRKSNHPPEEWITKTFPDRAEEIIDVIEFYFALQEESIFR